MPFNGTGTFVPAITFVLGSPATAADQNTQDTDIASGLSDCMTRDGQAPATANLSMGGFQLNEVGTGVAPGDAVNLGQAGSIGIVSEVRMIASSTIPTNWFLCYGQAISRTTYAALFTAIGTTFGVGDGSTTFNIPDQRGRVAAGVDNMGGTAANRITTGVAGFDGTILGNSGGDENYAQHNHAITDPTHTHGITDPGHQHLWGNGANGGTLGAGSIDASFINSGTSSLNTNPNVTGITNIGAATGITINNAGVGVGANVQPTAMFNFIIYAGAPST